MSENVTPNVYVVTRGEYSDYHILAVFDDEGLATRYAELKGGYVEEYELNAGADFVRRGLGVWQVYVDREGHATATAEEHGEPYEPDHPIFTEPWTDHPPMLSVECLARDAAHAIKIANERRVGLLLAGRWPDD